MQILLPILIKLLQNLLLISPTKFDKNKMYSIPKNHQVKLFQRQPSMYLEGRVKLPKQQELALLIKLDDFDF